MNANDVEIVTERAARRTRPVGIEAAAVTKRYPGFQLGPITLSIALGEAVALLGENGSGKSTLFRLLAGLVRPDGGVLTVRGTARTDHSARVNAECGFVSEDLGLYAAGSMKWHLDLVRGLRPQFDPARGLSLCRRFAIDPTLRAGSFSRGQRLRALFVLALAHRPAVLLVDEGTAGLDVATRRDTLSYLDGLRRDEGLAIVFSSHLPEDTEFLATRRVLLDAGQVVHDTRHTPSEAR